MKAILKNLLTGKLVEVTASTDSPDSSYGLYAWVDKDGNSYGQCQFGAPFGFEIVEVSDVDPNSDVAKQCASWLGRFV